MRTIGLMADFATNDGAGSVLLILDHREMSCPRIVLATISPTRGTNSANWEPP